MYENWTSLEVGGAIAERCGVPNNAEVMEEESFGPILPALAVAEDDEALMRMNETHHGLTASIWTRDQGRAEWFARELEAAIRVADGVEAADRAALFKTFAKVFFQRHGLLLIGGGPR
jgi:acyl-CoA reductase-like NAD-dependent aldehyde dehydrogenase